MKSEWPQTQGAPTGLVRSSIASPRSSQLRYRSDFASSEQYGTPSENNRDSRIYVRIHHPESATIRATDGTAAPSQSDDFEQNWSALVQRVRDLYPGEATGNPEIDDTTKLLLDLLTESAKTMGQVVPPGMRASVFGIHVHTDFAKRVEGFDHPRIGKDGIEQSWSAGDFARYGLAGSLRTDIYLKDRFGHLLAIYDLKTGNARLTAKRADDLRRAVGRPDIPVIELWYGDLTARQP